MAIKQIDSLPATSKKMSSRVYIRADIEEAINNNIELFEFVGDYYNYKYLAGYARQEARKIFRRKVHDRFRELCKEKGYENLYPDMYLCDKLFQVKSITEKDRKHVYMSITLKNFDLLVNHEVEKQYQKQLEWERKETERIRKIQ